MTQKFNLIKNLGINTFGLKLFFLNSSKPNIRLYDGFVCGLYNHSFHRISQILTVNSEINLVREALNTEDSFAIAVYFENYKLGYIPVYENSVLENTMKETLSIKGYITAINPKNTYEGLAIKVTT